MKEKLGAVAVCLLFALPFGGVGAFASWALGVTLYDGWRAQDWVRVKAQVDGYNAGDIQYRYAIGGREYTGRRLAISPLDGVDDIGPEMDARLTAARTERKPITVWVNPDRPVESVVDREWGWRSVVFMIPFAFAFGGVGLGALVWAGVLLRGERAGRAASATLERWKGVGFLWLFAFFWNSIAFPIGIIVVDEAVRDGEWLALLVLLFPLIGFLLLVGAIMATVNALRGRGPAATPAAPPPEKKRPRFVGDEEPAMAMAAVPGDAPSVPAAAGLRVDPLKKALAGQPVEGLTQQQQRALKDLTPEQRAQVGKLLLLGPKIKKVALIVGIVFIALMVLPEIVALVILLLKEAS